MGTRKKPIPPASHRLEASGALKEMRTKFAPAPDASDNDILRYKRLETLVVEACDAALKYRTLNGGGDQYASRRERDSKFLRELPAHINTLKKVIAFIRRNKEYLSHALFQHAPC